MKRSLIFLSMFQPLYVIFASSIGFTLANALFMKNWNSPFLTRESNGHFVQVSAPNFIAFVFVVAIMLAFVTVVFLPLWKQLIDLVRENISGQNTLNKLGTLVMLLLGALSFILVLQVYTQISSSVRIMPEGLWPAGLAERLGVLLSISFIAIMPVPLIILLIFGKTYEVTKKISSHKGDEKKLLGFAYDLIRYRNLLQNCLLIIGVIVSGVPIITAIMRSAFMELDATGKVETMWPILYPLMYGLGFTTVLIMFYAPAHLMLNQAGRQLRDTLCPIDEISAIDKTINMRKELDDWLQINLNLVENLKAGVFTLAPLITGFITSIPGLKIF